MKLKRLILQGFKSFKDRTTIHFDEGVTGIVGPNGCGKSNIVDALFWVMGEQSAKHLRGASMKDLIFSGSQKYNPASWAEVSLILENDTKKHIHIGNQVVQPEEIQLTRKLYKNSETEYRINGSICRLKDIQEVFMDTGAGAKSYSIIAQGEIDRLVKAKPLERRMMIEEVAGITKFKWRKKESLKKIEHTETNLNRLRDVQSEIEKNLKMLKGQAEKAERAKNLKERIIRNELSVFSNKEFSLLKDIKDFKEKTISIRTSLEDWKTEKDKLELDIEEELLERDELEANFEEKQSHLNELSKSLAAKVERLSSLSKSVEDKQKFSDGLSEEREELLQSIADRKTRKEELENELKDLERVAGIETNIEQLEEELTLLKEDLDQRRSTFNLNEEKIRELKTNIHDCTTRQLENGRRVEDLSHQIQNVSFDLENLERRFSDQHDLTEKITKEVNLHESTVEELSGRVEEKKEKIQTLSSELKTKNEAHRDLFKKQVVLEAELSSLEDMHKNHLSSQKTMMKYFDDNPEMPRDLLADLIEVSEEYAQIAQQILKDKLSYIPVDKVNNSLSVYLNPENKENIGFIAQMDLDENSEIKERIEVNGVSTIKDLTNFVQAKDDKHRKLVRSLFHGYYIFDNNELDQVLNLPIGIDFKGLISSNGKFIVKNEGGVKLFTLSEQGESLGPLERGNKIKELRANLDEINDLLANGTKAIEELELSLSALQDELRTEESELLTHKLEWESKKKNIENDALERENLEKQVTRYRENKEELSRKKLETMQGEENAKSQIQEWDLSCLQLTDENSGSLDQIQDLESTYEEKREHFLSVQMQMKTLDQQFKSLNSQIEDLEKQITREEGKEQGNLEKIEAYKIEIENAHEEKTSLLDSNKELEEGIAEREIAIADLKSALSELQDAMQEREEKIKDFSGKIVKNEKTLIESDVKINKAIEEEELLARDTFEKHQVDVRKSVIAAMEVKEEIFDDLQDLSTMYMIESENGPVEVAVKPYEFRRRYGQDLQDLSRKLKSQKMELGRLGDINWQAIEEYEQQKKRYEFISNQEFELKKSLENLFAAIEQIDEKCQGRFQDAFHEVNSRFTKVFPIIFGGGAASLKVVGDINTDEAGIDIVAQPPGKKMQSINLMSGGEKALTAVSLIFSIFLVKPSPFCLLDEVDAPLDDANVGRFNELLREMSSESQFILITHNKKTMEMNDSLYGVTMQEAGVSKVVSVQLQ